MNLFSYFARPLFLSVMVVNCLNLERLSLLIEHQLLYQPLFTELIGLKKIDKNTYNGSVCSL